MYDDDGKFVSVVICYIYYELSTFLYIDYVIKIENDTISEKR